jgi:hypothetical protein
MHVHNARLALQSIIVNSIRISLTEPRLFISLPVSLFLKRYINLSEFHQMAICCLAVVCMTHLYSSLLFKLLSLEQSI